MHSQFLTFATAAAGAASLVALACLIVDARFSNRRRIAKRCDEEFGACRPSSTGGAPLFNQLSGQAQGEHPGLVARLKIAVEQHDSTWT